MVRARHPRTAYMHNEELSDQTLVGETPWSELKESVFDAEITRKSRPPTLSCVMS